MSEQCRLSIVALLVVLASAPVSMAEETARRGEVAEYQAARVPRDAPLHADWDEEPWKSVSPLSVSLAMGNPPDHRPKTQAKVVYDDRHLDLIFRVEDRFVRAVARGYHDSVCLDSCVEFFFTPNGDAQAGYLNLEINCCGVMLFGVHTPQLPNGLVAVEDCDRIEIVRSLPQKTIEPEIASPIAWTVAVRLPFDVVRKYVRVEQPQPGTVWRANFYKCGDQTSHPHWLTWSQVDRPQPDFHQPAFFGRLTFAAGLNADSQR